MCDNFGIKLHELHVLLEFVRMVQTWQVLKIMWAEVKVCIQSELVHKC